jgi:hypothetical protein
MAPLTGGQAAIGLKRILIDPQIEQYQKAKADETAGRTSEMVGHSVAAAVPVLGPAAASVGERAGTGDIAGAAGLGTGMYAVGKAIQAAPKVPGAVADAVKSQMTPTYFEDLAARAKQYRAANPIGENIMESVNLKEPLRSIPAAGRAVKSAAAGAVAPVLQAAADRSMGGTAAYTPYGEVPGQQGPADLLVDKPLPKIPQEILTAREALLEDGKPRSAANVDRATQNAKYLLDAEPSLRGIKPGLVFNKRLFNALDNTGHALRTAEESLPSNTPVPVGDAGAAIQDIADNAAQFGESTAVKAAGKLVDLFQNGTITWEQFLKEKRAFFDEVKLSSPTGKSVYAVLQNITADMNPELARLNQKWYTLKTSSELAEMSPFSGEKLRTAAKEMAKNQKERGK